MASSGGGYSEKRYMSKKKILIVTQEMQPYTALSEISEMARKLPQYVQEKGMEIRILMPRFGTINERRHRLHEVVRLSGMNIIVDDDDYPLIIKVASVQGARMQVYFLDNEDFFKRKSVFENGKGEVHKDNPDRMIFFCKGVIETVKKFGWPPDIVHCHGWMTSLLPAFIREAYKTEPLFHNSKIIYSVYNNNVENKYQPNFLDKAAINHLEPEDLAAYADADGVNLHQGAIAFADALIQGSETLDPRLQAAVDASDLPLMAFPGKDSTEYLPATIDYYRSLTEQEEEVEAK